MNFENMFALTFCASRKLKKKKGVLCGADSPHRHSLKHYAGSASSFCYQLVPIYICTIQLWRHRQRDFFPDPCEPILLSGRFCNSDPIGSLTFSFHCYLPINDFTFLQRFLSTNMMHGREKQLDLATKKSKIPRSYSTSIYNYIIFSR